MQQLLDNLASNFPSYHERIGNHFNKMTACWDVLFTKAPEEISRGLLHIINTFLNSDKKQLFIQFPTDKLGKKEEEQKANLQNIQETVSDILFLATKESWINSISCPEIQDTKLGEFYYSADRVWEIKDSKQDLMLRPSSSKGPGRTSDARILFNAESRNGIRLSNIQQKDENGDVILRNGKKITCKKIRDWHQQISLYRSLPAIYSASSCILIGTRQNWQSRPIECGCITSPITFSSNYDKVRDTGCDILVFLWDRKYKFYERDLNNLIVEGKVKKIIFIGTEIFEGFKQDSNNTWFSFSFRELFSYYFGISRFPRIVYKEVSFPNLTNIVSNIQSQLPEHIEEQERKRILRFALYPYIGINASKPEVDRFRNFLWDNYEILSAEDIDNLVSAVERIPTNNHSPKKIEFDRINSKKDKIVICPSSAYKKELNSSLKTTNSTKQDYVIDPFFDSHWIVETIKTLLEKGCLGTYYILSYFKLPILKEFFEYEIKVYNDVERFSYIGFGMNISSVPDCATSGNLLDFFDATLDDLSQIFTTTPVGRQSSYICNFNDAEGEDEVYGDVIVASKSICVDELFNNQDYLPCTITYYSTPLSFQHLMEIYFNFPKGQTVESFSELWKNRMQELLRSKYSNNAETMLQDFRFLKLDKLKAVTRKTYKPSFPEEIGQIAMALYKEGVISSDQARLIKAANSVVGKHSSKAKELKSSLFQYVLTNEIDGFLKQVLNNANARGESLTAEQIVNEALKTRQLVDIKINKR